VLLALTAAYLPGTSVSSHQSSARGTPPITHRKSRPASENRRNIGGETLLRKRRPAVTCLLSTMENHLKGIIKNRSLAWPALSGRLVLAAAEFRAKCSAPLRETLVGIWHRPFRLTPAIPAEFPRSPVTNQQCSVAECVRSSCTRQAKRPLEKYEFLSESNETGRSLVVGPSCAAEDESKRSIKICISPLDMLPAAPL
jgi:hypothetical protein